MGSSSALPRIGLLIATAIQSQRAAVVDAELNMMIWLIERQTWAPAGGADCLWLGGGIMVVSCRPPLSVVGSPEDVPCAS